VTLQNEPQVHSNYKNQTYEASKTFIRARFENDCQNDRHFDLTEPNTGGKLSPNMLPKSNFAPRSRRNQQPLSRKEGRAFLHG